MQSETQPVRIDKWLWAVRIFKTRSLATEACKAGKVKIGGQVVKPSRDVRINELIVANTETLTRTVKVLGFIEKRVGAALVAQFAEDLTPPEEYQKRREVSFLPVMVRPKGSGRPTKKQRRDIEPFL